LLSDFRSIRNFVPWVYEQNTAARAALRLQVDSHSIVITHHLPSWRSVAPMYAGQPGNIFFVSDEEALILDSASSEVRGQFEADDRAIAEDKIVSMAGSAAGGRR
jgi:hypothetical protein